MPQHVEFKFASTQGAALQEAHKDTATITENAITPQAVDIIKTIVDKIVAD